MRRGIADGGNVTDIVNGIDNTNGDQKETPNDLQMVGVTLQEALGRDPNPEQIDRSEVVQLAVRLGFQEAVPELVKLLCETVRDAINGFRSPYMDGIVGTNMKMVWRIESDD